MVLHGLEASNIIHANCMTDPLCGVEELDQAKLTPLLRLKYHDSIIDAVADLGQPEEVGHAFTGFQQYLYQQQVVA